MWWKFIVIEKKITMISAIKNFIIYLIIIPKERLYDDELFVFFKSCYDPEDTSSWFFDGKNGA